MKAKNNEASRNKRSTIAPKPSIIEYGEGMKNGQVVSCDGMNICLIVWHTVIEIIMKKNIGTIPMLIAAIRDANVVSSKPKFLSTSPKDPSIILSIHMKIKDIKSPILPKIKTRTRHIIEVINIFNIFSLLIIKITHALAGI